MKYWFEAQAADPTASMQGRVESLGDTAPSLDATQTEEEGAFSYLLTFYQSQRMRMPGKHRKCDALRTEQSREEEINKRTDVEMATPFCWTPSHLYWLLSFWSPPRALTGIRVT